MRLCIPLAAAATLLVAGALTSATPAWAGAGVITTTVTPLASNVTYSIAGTRPLVTYVGYVVSVGNAGGNTVNNIRVLATASATDPAETLSFASAEGATCAAVAGAPATVECTVGQLTAGSTFPNIVVFFTAPAKVVNGVADTAGSDSVLVSGTTFYAEGTGGFPQSTPINSTVQWAAAPVSLGTSNPTLVRTSVPKAGGTFFTGDGAVATVTDPWTTSVVVPPAASYTTAEVLETETPVLPCQPGSCFDTRLTIPGSFAALTIILRRDATTIVPKAKIANEVIFYVADTGPNAGVPIQLLACSATNPVGPAPHVPCLRSRTEFTKRTAPTPAWEGDWQFEIRALDNGRYIN